MDNSSNLNTNNNDSSVKKDNPKGRLNKKTVIISSLVTILIIITILVLIFITQSSRIMEKYINAQFSRAAVEFGVDLDYKPFKCSGIKEITCSIDFIEIHKSGKKITAKNLLLKAKPSLVQLNAGVTGNIEISPDYSNNDNVINIDLNCTDNMTLLTERSLLAHNFICDYKVNNINISHQSIFYMQDDIYAQNSMVSVLKAFAENKIDLATQLVNYTVIESSSSKIESPALADDISGIVQVLAKSYGNETLTKDMVLEIYRALKEDYIKLRILIGSNKYTNIMDNFIQAIDGVVYDNDNIVSITMDIIDKDNIDNMFGSEYIRFMIPDSYNIDIKSYK